MKRKTSKKAQLTGQSSSSSVSDLLVSTTKSYLSGKYTARRLVVNGSDVESKTCIHYLNPRNQDALTIEAVNDIYDSIIENGVSQEGVAIEIDGKYHLLDSSRRRYCCVIGAVNLPLWVIDGEPSDQELLKLINDSQEVKRWSYPEHAKYLLKIADLKGISVESLNISESAKLLSIGKESLRKRLESLQIAPELLEVFVDYEGIPNTFYGKIAKCQRKLLKNNIKLVDFVKEINKELKSSNKGISINDRQLQTMKLLEKLADEKDNAVVSPQWEEERIGTFTQKDIWAKRKVSKDGRKTIYELTRLPAEKQKEIDDFIRQALS